MAVTAEYRSAGTIVRHITITRDDPAMEGSFVFTLRSKCPTSSHSIQLQLWIILQLLDKLNLCEVTKNRQIKVFSQNVCWITKEMI